MKKFEVWQEDEGSVSLVIFDEEDENKPGDLCSALLYWWIDILLGGQVDF